MVMASQCRVFETALRIMQTLVTEPKMGAWLRAGKLKGSQADPCILHKNYTAMSKFKAKATSTVFPVAS